MTQDQSLAFSQTWKGKTLTNIDFFNHHKQYVYVGERQLFVDGAAELQFGEEYITIFFNMDKEMFDTSFKSVAELYGGEVYYKIHDDQHIDRSFIGQELLSVEPFFANFTPTDEDGNFLPDVDYFLEELVLHFANSKQLQLATVDYQIIHGSIDNVRISFVGEIMVNMGERVIIS